MSAPCQIKTSDRLNRFVCDALLAPSQTDDVILTEVPRKSPSHDLPHSHGDYGHADYGHADFGHADFGHGDW